MTMKLPKLLATSVVRGTRRGNSNGGAYIVDFEKQEVDQHIDWSTGEVDVRGRGGDRGLRGIAFNGDDIYIAASDELCRYDRSFKLKTSHIGQYLKDCHEICQFEQTIFLTSPGFDSLLAFDTDKKAYIWGYHLLRQLPLRRARHSERQQSRRRIHRRFRETRGGPAHRLEHRRGRRQRPRRRPGPARNSIQRGRYLHRRQR